MELVYVISDVHGCYDLMEQALEKFDPATMQLVLIGDLMDRGPDSKKTWRKALELVEKYGAIYLKGNHEDILENFLQNPADRLDNYLRNGGEVTMESFMHPGVLGEYSIEELAVLWQNYYPQLLPSLQNRPYYYEFGDFIFVHAGVDLTLNNWKETSLHDLIWIREPFHLGKNNTGKTIVFGHTITPHLHGDNQTTNLWQSDHKIGIDGGAVYGGTMHGVLFSKDKLLKDYQFGPLEDNTSNDSAQF
ncbi:metallophosphoesterase family protein [Enterococcus timonensis]|uniref:metallophosphoesterase family protein n=1 Tax=Enterococcus timonensis TaxID=1852364 RepID=UPI0008D95B70|nr:metallophosphoesterase family protein [Enterococcus timonensis]